MSRYIVEGSGTDWRVIDQTNGMSVARRKNKAAAVAAKDAIEDGSLQLWDMPLI